jgi:hypothetical protein
MRQAGRQYFENACHGKHKFNFAPVTEKKCVANFLVTTFLLQNIEVAFLHMA